jgi:hypothetical protein
MMYMCLLGKDNKTNIQTCIDMNPTPLPNPNDVMIANVPESPHEPQTMAASLLSDDTLEMTEDSSQQLSRALRNARLF